MSVLDRLRGDFEVDAWGCDPAVQDAIDAVIRPLLRIDISGEENLPGGRCTLVSNRRFGVLEPMVLGRAVRMATRRRLRVVGLPDLAPFATVLRRAGAVVNHPAEVAGLLRDGRMVALPLSVRFGNPPMAGDISPDDMAGPLAAQSPVVPVSITGGEFARSWRVAFGAPVPCPKARGPLALAELADAARNGVQALLDEATPPRWPWS